MNAKQPPVHHLDPGGATSAVARDGDVSRVVKGRGYLDKGCVACEMTDTHNGFIARFPAAGTSRQDYYVCLDYSQARDLVLAFSAFAQELGFEP